MALVIAEQLQLPLEFPLPPPSPWRQLLLLPDEEEDEE